MFLPTRASWIKIQAYEWFQVEEYNRKYMYNVANSEVYGREGRACARSN